MTMETGFVVGLVFLALGCAILVEVPVAFALAGAGALGVLLLRGPAVAGQVIASVPYSASSPYQYAQIALFIVMGTVVGSSGLAGDVYDVVSRVMARLPGGIAVATVIAAVFIGGITGSSAADVATIGPIAIKEMQERGYKPAFAAAVVAGSGTIAILIPPSIALIVYGILTHESIGSLLIAGILPGALSALVLSIFIVLRVRFRRANVMTAAARPGLNIASLDPAVSAKTPTVTVAGRHPQVALAGGGKLAFVASPMDVKGSVGNLSSAEGGLTLRGRVDGTPTRRARLITSVLSALALFLIVIGGIYSGMVTTTEAGALGAVVAFVLTVMRVGLGRRFAVVAREGLSQAASITGMIFGLIIGSSIFTFFLVEAGVPDGLTQWVLGLPLPPKVVIGLLLLVLIPMGTFLEGLSLLLVTVPIVYPVVTRLGFSGIWFGILLIKVIEISLIAPPLGLNVYILGSLRKDLRVDEIFPQILPFIVADVCVMVIIFVFPQIATWLPNVAHPKG